MDRGIRNNMVKVIDWVALSLLGIFCFCYSIFYSYFAELHIQLPFLNFPIFMGEILLGICMVLLFLKLRNSSFQFSKWHYFAFAYIAFIIIKVFFGYLKWGPLALRHSALFYYFLFAAIGYYLLNTDLLHKKIVSILAFLALSAMIIFRIVGSYFLYTHIILLFTLALSLKMPSKTLKYLVILILFLIIPYKALVQVPRSILVSQAVTLLFLTTSFCYLIKVKFRYKAISALIVLIISGLLISNFTPKTEILSLVSPSILLKQYRIYMSLIKEREKTFKPLPDTYSPVKLYVKNFFDPSVGRMMIRRVAIIERQGTKSGKRLAERALKKATLNELKEMHLATKEQNTEQFMKILEMSLSERRRIIKQEAFEKQRIAESAKKAKVISEKEKKAPLKEKTAEVSIVEKGETIKELKPLQFEKLKQKKFSGCDNNIAWRIFVWKDMLGEIFKSGKNFLVGTDFGKPFRSRSAEILGMECGLGPGFAGWLEPHNSYIHILYRAGLIGLLFIIIVLGIFIRMVTLFLRKKDIIGVLLCSSLLFWLTDANFAVILELPYFAIPFWALFGVVLRYNNDSSG